MLNREQRKALIRAAKRIAVFDFPKELIYKISKSAQDETEFSTALRAVTFGELETLRTLLEKAKLAAIQTNTTTVKEVFLNPLKELLFNRGQTVTPGGMTIKSTALLEAAFLAGDPEMVAMIKPYFSEVEGGQEEMERQLTRIRPCIEAMKTQEPEDLIKLFDIIKAASTEDVIEELQLGEQYNNNHKSLLRNALNNWRQTKLAPDNREINVAREPRMFCNYQNWIHANGLLLRAWALHDRQPWIHKLSDSHILLILRQLRGFLELLELPAYERFAFANGEVEKSMTVVPRSFKYKNQSNRSFPHFDPSLIDSHTGLGFGFYVRASGAREEMYFLNSPRNRERDYVDFIEYFSKKCDRLTKLLQTPQHTPTPRVGR